MGFLQCNGGKLQEAEDFKSVFIVYFAKPSIRRFAGFLQCNGGKLEEAEDFKSVFIVYYEIESK